MISARLSKIHPLIRRQFPDLYQTGEAENFIAFVEAYYQWLDENVQLLEVEDPSLFHPGDPVFQPAGLGQDPVTGTVITKTRDNQLVVLVNDYATFKCFNVCNVIEPLINRATGAKSIIRRGGTRRRLGVNFLLNHVVDTRDVDTTLDIFIAHFKAKYLPNIEYSADLSQRTLIKNALAIYRSKGTERATDLFFRLVFGTSASVYLPSQDVLRASAAEWTKPVYLEIAVTNVARAINLIGKQVRGVISDATAFVEKLIRRKIKNGFVNIFYISNVRGTFEPGELLIAERSFLDSPTVIGSLAAVEIITGGRNYRVGDLVSFNSGRGDYGLARVAAVSSRSGVVDFLLLDGGWGYTFSANPNFSESELAKRTQSIVSEKVLQLSNARVSNHVIDAEIIAAGTGYTNGDTVSAVGKFTNARAQIFTNNTGAITQVLVSRPGAGFYSHVVNATIQTSTGTGGNVAFKSSYHNAVLKYFERFEQRQVNVAVNSSVNVELFEAGSPVTFDNTAATGTIVDGWNATPKHLKIVVNDLGTVTVGQTIRLAANSTINAIVEGVDNVSTFATIMGVPSEIVLGVNNVIGTFNAGVNVEQRDGANVIGTGQLFESAVDSGLTILRLRNARGVFVRGGEEITIGANATGNVQTVSFTLGVYNISNAFVDVGAPQAFSYVTGTEGNVTFISKGAGASFRVAEIGEPETISLNTDLLSANNVSNVPFMDVALDAVAYGFPKAPAGNSSTIVYACLNFDSFTIGSIERLGMINPGVDYNIDPYVLAYQPYISGFARRDYFINVVASGTFLLGERIVQTPTALTIIVLTLPTVAGYEVGEAVYQGSISTPTATGVIYEINPSINQIALRETTGTFVTGTELRRFVSSTPAELVSNVDVDSITVTAKGIVKLGGNATHLSVKRIQFDNYWTPGETITGVISGTTAVIQDVQEDPNTLPIGFNARIVANAAATNGSVTQLQIIDSGIGYAAGEIMIFIPEPLTDEKGAGEVKVIIGGQGQERGYYKTSKGFLSSLSKIHDGDFYQEFSYQILSRVPVERYAAMFRELMHPAGTKMFGGVLVEDDVPVSPGTRPADTLPYVTEYYELQFNANTNITSNAIVGVTSAFVNGDVAQYRVATGNTAVAPLTANDTYVIINATPTSLQLATNPGAPPAYFDRALDVSGTRVRVPRHSFVNGDVVRYDVWPARTPLATLNAAQYFITNTSPSEFSVALTKTGAPISIEVANVTSENGHFFVTSPIQLTPGATENGHFLVLLNK